MSRWNKKSKLITGIAVAGAAIIAVGSVALVSKGFKNMDARDWVDGYEHVLEVSEDQLLCETCYVDAEWKQEKRAEISFKTKEENTSAHSSVQLLDQEGKEFKRANVTISANISINEDTMAGITFGHDLATTGPEYRGIAFMLHYDKDSELLRVVAYNDYNTWIDGEESSQHSLPNVSTCYTNSYSLSYYGISDLSKIKFSVSKVVTAAGSSYEVKVGNKTVDFLTHCDSNGNYVLIDGTSGDNVSYTESKAAYPVYLTAYGTEATFKEVKWSE